MASPVIADTVPTPTLGENSAYTLEKVNQAGENVITKYEWSDSENKYVPVYYRVDLKNTEYGHKDVASETKTFTIKTPNADGSGNAFNYEIKYYTDASRLAPSRVTTNQNGADIDKDFIGKVSSNNGGAIYNNQGTIGNITGDFVGNYSSGSGNQSGYGGAISNYVYDNSSAKIGDITGNFIGNHANRGGAISNYVWNNPTLLEIGNITGDFVGNHAEVFGGAIFNSGSVVNSSKIGNINGNFIGNYVQGSIFAAGGAIYNVEGTVGDITGDFIGNYVQSEKSSANGGAVYNYLLSAIGNVTGDFIGNFVIGTGEIRGGAIYNFNAEIGNVTGDFIGNYAYSRSGSGSNVVVGGAVYNIKEIESITGDFIENYTKSTNIGTKGGAIYNEGTIGDITGDFIGNYAQGGTASGGAIYNSSGTITLKDNSFINNGVISSNNAKGGAIYIGGGTVNIVAENKDVIFEGNYSATAKNSDGTLKNKKSDGIYLGSGTLNLLSNDKNIIINDSLVADSGTVNLLNGTLKFGKDSIFNVKNISFGSADINNVTLDVENGLVSECSIGNITLNSDLNLKIDMDLAAEKVDSFNISNVSTNGHSFNVEDINILSDLGDSDYAAAKFLTTDKVGINISDSVDSYLTSNYKYDISLIEDSGNSYLFVKKDGISLGLPYAIKEKGNIVYSQTEDEIINRWILSSDIQSDKFTLHGNNHTITSTNGTTEGFYIASGKELYIDNVKNISGFNSQNGGAINAAGKLDVSNSTFSNNTATVNGGAINISPATAVDKSNLGVICGGKVTYGNESIEGFAKDSSESNPVNGYNLIIFEKTQATSQDEFDSLKEELAQQIASGEVVDSPSDLPTTEPNGLANEMLAQISKMFQKVTVKYNGEVLGSYILNGLGGNEEVEFGLTTLGSSQSSDPVEYVISNTLFESNKAQNGGAVSIVNNPMSIEDILQLPDMGETDISSEVSSKEEALAMIEQMIQAGQLIPSFDDLISEDYVVNLPDPIVTFVNTSFINNKAESKGGAIYANTDVTIKADNGTSLFKGNTANGESNAIYLDNADKTINLVAVNKGVIQFDDKIDGAAGYQVKISGDNAKSSVLLNNNVDNASVTSEKVYLNLGKNNVFENSDFTINSGTLGFINGVAEQQIMKSANINGSIDLALDVDLQNEKMDTLPENVIVSDTSKIGVNNLNLLNDAKEDLTNIQFATSDYKSQVSYTGANPVAYSPIYKYEVAYNPDEGFFTFTRGGGSGNPSDNFNPSVLAPSVIQQAGAYTTQLQTFNYAFQHSDTFMNIPYLERTAMRHSGRYALSPTGDATDVGTFSPLLTKEDTSGFWVKPYASFENIPLNNGPKVSNINYGTLVGYDSSLTPIAKGWERVLTGYIGYNGASQRYSGVDAYQNGGILGGTATLYKGNFFNATTLSVGATAGDASTMYGNENYAMLLAGIGNKTGYNFEFKDGRIILQPNFLISYTFVNTFDYTNGAGVRIKSDPLNAIQLAPGLKLIGNTKNGWQPYLSVAMIWNLLDDSKVTANDVRLPEMSIDPYVQYGAGIQKRFKDRFLAFGQAMIHNGGRNGVSLTAGLRWKVGK